MTDGQDCGCYGFDEGFGEVRRRGFLHLATLAGATAALTAALPAPSASADQPRDLPSGSSLRKVLLFDLDGVRRDLITPSTTPVLWSLALRGQLSHTKTHMPLPRTVSGPGHANILTAVWPGKHRVMSNSVTSTNLATYPDFLTRLRKVKRGLSTFAVSDSEAVIRKLTASPSVKQTVRSSAGSGTSTTTQRIRDWATAAVRDHNPDVGYVHFLRPDRVGHAYGGKSRHYAEAVTEVDRAIGTILDSLFMRRSRLLEKWLILATTDHGHVNAGGHGGSQTTVRNIWTIAAGGYVPPRTPGSTTTRMVDLVPTAFKHLGVPIKSAWRLDGKPIPG